MLFEVPAIAGSSRRGECEREVLRIDAPASARGGRARNDDLPVRGTVARCRHVQRVCTGRSQNDTDAVRLTLSLSRFRASDRYRSVGDGLT